MEELETEGGIKRDRERLSPTREETAQRSQAAQQELADIERRFKAIEAFEAALRNVRDEQEPASPARRGRPKKAPPKAERASRGERQQQLYEIIRVNPGSPRLRSWGNSGRMGKRAMRS